MNPRDDRERRLWEAMAPERELRSVEIATALLASLQNRMKDGAVQDARVMVAAVRDLLDWGVIR
jgi:hypothetical protein